MIGQIVVGQWMDQRVESGLFDRRDDSVREDRYHRVERAYGAFSRSFTLPNTVDGGRVRAEYRDGVLTIVMPPREEARPRQIQVEVND